MTRNCLKILKVDLPHLPMEFWYIRLRIITLAGYCVGQQDENGIRKLILFCIISLIGKAFSYKIIEYHVFCQNHICFVL